MPLYQYQCQRCEKIFEELQKVTDPELTECVECSGELKRVFGNVNHAWTNKRWTGQE